MCISARPARDRRIGGNVSMAKAACRNMWRMCNVAAYGLDSAGGVCGLCMLASRHDYSLMMFNVCVSVMPSLILIQ